VLDSSVLRLIKEGAKEEWLDILRCIANGTNDVKSIARKLGKDRSTVRRQLSLLEKSKLVKARKRKPLTVELSPLAELLL
jgi:CRISPR locus-related DNA-binding protein